MSGRYRTFYPSEDRSAYVRYPTLTVMTVILPIILYFNVPYLSH
jgi:hypothetical protein